MMSTLFNQFKLNNPAVQFAAIVYFSAIGTLHAADTAVTKITGKVVVACEVNAPATVNIQDIPYTPAMDNKENIGKNMGLPGTSLRLKGNCGGGSKFKYTLTPSDWDSHIGCIDPAPKASVYLCVFHNDKRLDFIGGKHPVIESVNGRDETLLLTPFYGASPKATSFSATLTFKVEPL